ncbi:MAG: insulinase family protein [Bacteroidia bacterium]|nr:insulinase family protein [Bacteroidia bacterium]
MKKQIILILLAVGICSLTNAQKRYSTFEIVKQGKLSYKKYSGDPTQSRWYTLPNGLTVILAVNKDQPRIQTLIATKAGSKNDPHDNTGLAHYLEHMLFKGTDKYGTQDFAKEKVYLDKIDELYETYNKTTDVAQRIKVYRAIDSLSGLAANYSIANEYDKICLSIGAQGTNAFTSVEQTVYVNDIPSNQYHKWIELESERFRNPVLRLFHTELEAVYEEKNISLDNDASEAYEKLYASLFRRHSYGTQTTIGTIEHLKNPSLKKIRQYYYDNYVPNNMAIIMAGDFDPDEVIYAINEHFAYMKPKEIKPFKVEIEYPRMKPDSISVTGPDAANIMIGFRMPGAGTEEVRIMKLIDLILSNSKAGLIDLNLNKAQKVLSASSSPDIMKDYSVHLFSGKPLEGQTLEEVRDLLLAQIEKIKKGDFDENIIKGIIANNRVDEIRKLEGNSGIAYTMLNSFVTGVDWIEELNDNYAMSQITKQQIMDFAKEYYDNGYSIVYKRTGEDEAIAKVEKPQITEVVLNRDKSSAFTKDLIGEQSDAATPVYVDYNKDITYLKSGKAPVLYVQNKQNDLFSLYYVMEVGRFNDKRLPFALDYLQYLGTKNISADEISKKFYALACNFGISSGDKQSYVSLNGLQENFKPALNLFEELLANAEPDQKVLDEYIDRILKSRADQKLSKRAINSALGSYSYYGKNNPRTYTLSNAELKGLKASDLVALIKNLTRYEHKVLYYGPATSEVVISELNTAHKQPETWLVAPAAVVFTPTENTENIVYFTDYDMVQAEITWRHRSETFDQQELPVITAFNEYFGGGMSSVVFQEIRESRALAYSTYSVYGTPDEKGKNNTVIAYIGTQADKFNEAIVAMNSLLNELPESESSFLLAKQAILSSIENERINKERIFFDYLTSIEMGYTHDTRKDVYDAVKNLTFAQLKAFHKAKIANQKFAYSVLASKDRINVEDLKKYGRVVTLSIDEIFGY